MEKKESRWFGFFKEYKNISWPKRAQVWKFTLIVIGFVLAVSVFLALVDLAVNFLVNSVFGV